MREIIVSFKIRVQDRIKEEKEEKYSKENLLAKIESLSFKQASVKITDETRRQAIASYLAM